MKTHLANSTFGALDYIAYPAGMLLLAPAILRSLGINLFGIWAMANAVLMTGAILASGFADANLQAVAQARAQHDRGKLITTVRSALGIHLTLGLIAACVVWLSAPSIARLTVKTHVELTGDCCWSIRITSGLVLIRALETVCVSAHRAFDRYGAAIGVSVTARLASLLVAWLVPLITPGVTPVLAVTLATSAMALGVQLRQLNLLLGTAQLVPMFDRIASKSLLTFGIFTSIQAAGGLLVGQVDRLIAGFALGTSAVTVYAICAQLAQPIYGIAAAGLHFLFPLLASIQRGSRT